jgi:hypothetical protein
MYLSDEVIYVCLLLVSVPIGFIFNLNWFRLRINRLPVGYPTLTVYYIGRLSDSRKCHSQVASSRTMVRDLRLSV